jgi:hypothetical protein
VEYHGLEVVVVSPCAVVQQGEHEVELVSQEVLLAGDVEHDHEVRRLLRSSSFLGDDTQMSTPVLIMKELTLQFLPTVALIPGCYHSSTDHVQSIPMLTPRCILRAPRHRSSPVEPSHYYQEAQ